MGKILIFCKMNAFILVQVLKLHIWLLMISYVANLIVRRMTFVSLAEDGLPL